MMLLGELENNEKNYDKYNNLANALSEWKKLKNKLQDRYFNQCKAIDENENLIKLTRTAQGREEALGALE